MGDRGKGKKHDQCPANRIDSKRRFSFKGASKREGNELPSDPKSKSRKSETGLRARPGPTTVRMVSRR